MSGEDDVVYRRAANTECIVETVTHGNFVVFLSLAGNRMNQKSWVCVKHVILRVYLIIYSKLAYTGNMKCPVEG